MQPESTAVRPRPTSAEPSSAEPASAEPRFTPGHVGLNVTDLARASAFYAGVFGFTVGRESRQPGREFVFLARPDDGEVVLTLWRQATGGAARQSAGLHHLAFRVGSTAELRAVEERLRRHGARIHHGGVAAHAAGAASGGLFFEDPDGIRLEVFTALGGGDPDATAPYGEAPTCGFF